MCHFENGWGREAEEKGMRGGGTRQASFSGSIVPVSDISFPAPFLNKNVSNGRIREERGDAGGAEYAGNLSLVTRLQGRQGEHKGR